MFTRREMLKQAGAGFGMIGLLNLLHEQGLIIPESIANASDHDGLGVRAINPLAPSWSGPYEINVPIQWSQFSIDGCCRRRHSQDYCVTIGQSQVLTQSTVASQPDALARDKESLANASG